MKENFLYNFLSTLIYYRFIWTLLNVGSLICMPVIYWMKDKWKNVFPILVWLSENMWCLLEDDISQTFPKLISHCKHTTKSHKQLTVFYYLMNVCTFCFKFIMFSVVLSMHNERCIWQGLLWDKGCVQVWTKNLTCAFMMEI